MKLPFKMVPFSGDIRSFQGGEWQAFRDRIFLRKSRWEAGYRNPGLDLCDEIWVKIMTQRIPCHLNRISFNFQNHQILKSPHCSELTHDSYALYRCDQKKQHVTHSKRFTKHPDRPCVLAHAAWWRLPQTPHNDENLCVTEVGVPKTPLFPTKNWSISNFKWSLFWFFNFLTTKKNGAKKVLLEKTEARKFTIWYMQ